MLLALGFTLGGGWKHYTPFTLLLGESKAGA